MPGKQELEVMDLGAPIDVLCFGLSKGLGDLGQAFGYVGAGQFMVAKESDGVGQRYLQVAEAASCKVAN
jgi:hypothetical protein